jgi:hypothetical protein
MKKQSNSSPSKAHNSTIKDLNNSEEEEISNSKFKLMKKMINAMKKERYISS